MLSSWLLLSLHSCGTTKYLDESEYLLQRNGIIFTEKVAEQNDLRYQLSTLYLQKPNSNAIVSLVPREWFYFRNAQKESGWNELLYKRFGEVPSIYSDSLKIQTAADMQAYLNFQGYLNAEVTPQVSARRQRMKVNYYVSPGTRFTIDSINYDSPDPVIDSLLQQAATESLFKSGAPLEFGLFAPERKRITSYMRNHGFAEFAQNHVADLVVDTSQRPKQANLYLSVDPPFGQEVHQDFFIGDITVYQDFETQSNNIVGDTTIAGIRFLLSPRGFIVSPNTFRKAISLRPGELFKQEAIEDTEKKLRELGIFRFVRIKPIADSLDTGFKHFSILLTPNYEMELSAGLDINYTNRSNTIVGGNLMGLSFSPTFQHRNFLGSAERFTSSLSPGVEVAWERVGQAEFWNTIDLRAEFDLTLPQFQDYLGIWHGIHRLTHTQRTVRTQSLYTRLRDGAQTHMNLSYNYLLILQWYRYNLLNVSYGYDLPVNRYERYRINHMAINVLNPVTDSLFEARLNQNEFLARSFGQQVFVSLLFRGLEYEKRTPADKRGRSRYFNLNFESAGGEIYGLNALYNTVRGRQDTFQLGPNIDFSQYVKTEVYFHINRQLEREQSLAARFNFGIAAPFGSTSDVPYVKQFFVGGANSMRAWAPRGLGPGGYVDTLSLNPENNTRLFQTGDLKLELNAEYRFPLLWRLKGAFFLDAGNVWTLRPDKNRPGSQFRFTQGERVEDRPFYKQIAIAGGMGFRLDLSYFIFRFDVGVKLRYNAPQDSEVVNPSESLWWNQFNDFRREDYGFGIGLGVPF
jgi:outer membrane protein assembly factor BamA